MKIRTTLALATVTLTLGVPVATGASDGYRPGIQPDAVDRYVANALRQAEQPDALARYLRNHPNGAESAVDSTGASSHPDIARRAPRRGRPGRAGRLRGHQLGERCGRRARRRPDRPARHRRRLRDARAASPRSPLDGCGGVTWAPTAGAGRGRSLDALEERGLAAFRRRPRMKRRSSSSCRFESWSAVPGWTTSTLPFASSCFSTAPSSPSGS